IIGDDRRDIDWNSILIGQTQSNDAENDHGSVREGVPFSQLASQKFGVLNLSPPGKRSYSAST
ncbi:hypothetical protein FRC12_024995, partial [Ceratobasidium sp. 428]